MAGAIDRARPAIGRRVDVLRHRLVDLAIVVIASPAWAPALAVIAALVRTVDGRPVLFRQERIGLGGRPFTILKFRTMTVSTGERHGAPDPSDVTRLGRLLRSTSLDEIPQLLNVLRGDMALVGPRPIRPEHLSRSPRFGGRRLTVRPGITGWAQVRGRNSLSWDEKLDLDLEYLGRRSVLFDISIMFRTFGSVVRRSNIEHGSQAR